MEISKKPNSFLVKYLLYYVQPTVGVKVILKQPWKGQGHIGNKEIANWLIQQGARTNLFVMTMLGQISVVKGFIEAFPTYLKARGPHGLTLLHHAQKGGENSKELLDYFMEKGLKETKLSL